MPFIRLRAWKKRTVQDVIQQAEWIRDIVGGLPVLPTWQFIQLKEVIDGIVLTREQSDVHTWIPTTSRQYTSKSAYECYFLGLVHFEPYRRLWKSWALAQGGVLCMDCNL